MTLSTAMVSNQGAMMGAPVSGGIGGGGGQMISIPDLIELAIKRAYKELTQMAELLPRKTDMERKIEIVKFANRNQQLFVRLLALVKWASTASKVDKCSQMGAFLDKQSAFFSDTANMLFQIKEQLAQGVCLPSFQIPAAVEALTQGTYSRLPTIIRDSVVPPDPLSNSEKHDALKRLNHIIRQRLVTTELPLQMRDIKIHLGRAIFTVENEFQLILTLMSDSSTISWRVLNVKILVEDKEINGIKELVFTHQLSYLQVFVQSRLNDSTNPLVDAYTILHSFCLSLQLEVLYSQLIYLSKQRLHSYLRCDDYVRTQKLALSYWNLNDPKKTHRLVVVVDTIDPSKPLQIKHDPDLKSASFTKSMQANILSIEKLLFLTINERSNVKLKTLKKFFEDKISNFMCKFTEFPATLTFPFMSSKLSEQLLISVDHLTGDFIVHIPQYEECPLLTKIEAALNDSDMEDLAKTLEELKYWVYRERIKRAVEVMPVTVLERLPLSPNNEIPLPEGDEQQQLFFKFIHHPEKYLLVTFVEQDHDLNLKYTLLKTKSDTTMMDSGENLSLYPFQTAASQKVFLIIEEIRETSARDVRNSIFCAFYNDSFESGIKTIEGGDRCEHCCEKFSLTEIPHVIGHFEEEFIYYSVKVGLEQRGFLIQHTVDQRSQSNVIKVQRHPPNSITSKLQNELQTCEIYFNNKNSKTWNVVCEFSRPHFMINNMLEKNFQKSISLEYQLGAMPNNNQLIDDLIADWNAIARLFDLVKIFSYDMKYSGKNFDHFEIKSYNYRKIIIAYGKSKSFFVSIHYKSQEKRFQLSFGLYAGAKTNSNPHNMTSYHLQREFNVNLNILDLLDVLDMTLQPLLTLQTLPSIPVVSVVSSRPHSVTLSFVIIPSSSTEVRLVYRNVFALNIKMCRDKVSIQDYSNLVKSSKGQWDELTPIKGFQTFIARYAEAEKIIDEGMPQLLSPNPDQHGFNMSGEDFSSNKQSMDNHNPSSMNPLSNQPHTPASPMTSVMNQQYMNSPGTFSVTSPAPNMIAPSPQLHSVQDQHQFINSPMNANLSAPSPGIFPVPSPAQQIQSPASQFHNQNSIASQEAVGSPFPSHNSMNPQSNMSMHAPSPAAPGGQMPWSTGSPMPRPSPHSQTGTQHPQHLSTGQEDSGTYSLSFASFERMCHIDPNVRSRPFKIREVSATCSPLECLFGCAYLFGNKTMKVFDKQEVIPGDELSIHVKTEQLQIKMFIDFTPNPSLHIHAASEMNVFSRDELDILQQYFETKIGSAPYNGTYVLVFWRLVSFHHKVLRDIIQIMAYELRPDPSLRWSVQIGLTFPPFGSGPTTAGMTSILFMKNRIFICFFFTRNPILQPVLSEPLVQPWALMYDFGTNTLMPNNSTASTMCLNQLNQFAKQLINFHSSNQDCIILPVVRDIIANFQYP